MTVDLSGTLHDGSVAIANGELGVALVSDGSNQRFIGLITDGDVRRAILMGADSKTPLEKIVNRNAKTAKQDTSSESIAQLLSHEVRAIPILNDIGIAVDIIVLDKRMRLPVSEPYLNEKELGYVTDCIVSGWISSSGKYVEKFESLVAEVSNAKFGIATSSGTAALHLALLAAGVSRGDEVIVPALTFISTATAVLHAGGTVVLVDIDEETMCIDPDLFFAAITPRTKAVIPVHLYGHPAQMNRLLEIAKQHEICVIEDAAEAQGATFDGSQVGSLGDMGIFSFYGNKTITTGEGGMVVTNDFQLAEKIRVLRDHGMDPNRRYWHTMLGFNYRMTNLQAAVGVGQMEKFSEILQRKRIVAESYSRLLSKVPGVVLPCEKAWANHSYWLYTILIDLPKIKNVRNLVIYALEEQNIEARPVFIPIHKQPIFKITGDFPVAERMANKGISLPSFATLKYADIEKICDVIKKTIFSLMI
tara:strand:- start:9583 stop:11010 length:1428 start_codon:yes stop_codon:yes gene_type:complete